jgi:rhamnopyranosyl-N-acetylglucosaminyl-diphospho-decaprenol beta-1,3/1,4-galactofuranosyltransferase
MCSVAAVVVTFNRKMLLLECIDALMKQSRPLQRIYIIDNASTDGTEEALRQQGILDCDEIEYVQLATNTGGAGGFHDGIKRAYDDGHDWIWIMDDDAEPTIMALSTLMDFAKSNSEAAALANLKLGLDGKPQRSHAGHLSICGPNPKLVKDIFEDGPLNGPVRVSFSSFVGLMISRVVVEKTGLPRKEFFIHHDDLEYCVRIAQMGFIMFLVPASIIVHKEAAKRADVTVGKIAKLGVSTPMERLWITYFGIRNLIWIKRHYCSAFSASLLLAYFVLKFGLGIIIFRDQKIKRLRFRMSSLIDGFNGNFDNERPRQILND